MAPGLQPYAKASAGLFGSSQEKDREKKRSLFSPVVRRGKVKRQPATSRLTPRGGGATEGILARSGGRAKNSSS